MPMLRVSWDLFWRGWEGLQHIANVVRGTRPSSTASFGVAEWMASRSPVYIRDRSLGTLRVDAPFGAHVA